MKRSITASLAAALSLALVSPALAQDEGEREPGSERIRVVGVNGYTVIDRKHLVLNGIGTRYYLVTLQRSCFNLRSGTQIGTSFGATATIFNPRFEYITTRGMGSGDFPDRCPIRTIEQVESTDAARALVEERAEEAEEGGPSPR